MKGIVEGMLVSSKAYPDVVWGKVISKTTGGHILVESFAQGTRHFMNGGKFIEFPTVIEPDDNDTFHAYAPKFKGLHTCGDTIEEAKANLEDAVRVYLQSMLKHNEIRFDGNTRRYYST